MTAANNLEDIYPLTPMQQGMLFHSLHAPRPLGMYVQQIEIRFRGRIDSDRLRGAWEAVVARHAALRTMFVWDEKKPPVQAVCRRVVLPWCEEDWTARGDAEDLLCAFLRENRVAGFELSTAPLMRLSLFRTANGAILIWTFHHLAIDGWSMSNLLREVLAIYAAACEGTSPRLIAPRPFRDYVAWLRKQNQNAALDFWRTEFEGFSGNPPLAIETDSGQPEAYSECEMLLSAEATAALDQLTRRERVTLSACVQTAWALLLSRYCGTHDIAFGVTHAGRPAFLPDVDAMIGMFLNTVPVRVRIRPNDSIGTILKRLFAGQPRREENSCASLAAIERACGAGVGNQLFDSLVVFENYPIQSVSLPDGLEVESVRGYDRTNYPLTLLAMPGRRLTLRLAWQTNRFTGEAISRMLKHLCTLFEAMPSALDQPAGRTSMLTAAERSEIYAWNRTERNYSRTGTLLDLLEEQAEKTPDAIAVHIEGDSATYRQLHERASVLAHHLSAMGARPEMVVAVEIERSLDLMVALMGIVKCGAAWLPLEVDHPAERRRLMARNAGALVSIIRRHGDERSCDRVLALDSLPRSAPSLTLRRPLPQNLAYVIYTSGSSGTPKGVMNTHEGIANRLLWMQEAFRLSADDTVLQKTPATFDVSVWEFFWPLIAGAKLAFAPPGAHKDADSLAAAIDREGVTKLHFVPSMLRTFIEYAPSPCASLRRVICSGEALPAELVNQFHNRFNAELHNLYGPTEAAIDVTHHACSRAETVTPIGLPIANTQTWVLDSQLSLVPVGVPGELYLGGIQLARGYCNRPALTADRFVPDPFSTTAGARLYRTGDRARLLANGEIEYLGRTDFQLKIRGFRVEPGEIEARLESHPAIAQAAVIGFSAAEGNRLAAYVTCRNGARPEAAELRAHLRQSLPEHMVPSVFITLDRLPLTTSGKTDSKVLTSIQAPWAITDRPSETGSGVESRSAIEREVTAIWEETLGTRGIGVRENFFDVGGNSLLLVPIHRKLVARFGTNLRVPDLFRYPTIDSLSARLSDLPASVPPAPQRAENALAAQRAARRQARGG